MSRSLTPRPRPLLAPLPPHSHPSPTPIAHTTLTPLLPHSHPTQMVLLQRYFTRKAGVPSRLLQYDVQLPSGHVSRAQLANSGQGNGKSSGVGGNVSGDGGDGGDGGGGGSGGGDGGRGRGHGRGFARRRTSDLRIAEDLRVAEDRRVAEDLRIAEDRRVAEGTLYVSSAHAHLLGPVLRQSGHDPRCGTKGPNPLPRSVSIGPTAGAHSGRV